MIISLLLEKVRYAFFLIVMQLCIKKRSGEQYTQVQACPDLPMYSNNKEDTEAKQHQHHRSPQIRLFCDQKERQENKKAQLCKVDKPISPLRRRIPADEIGQHKNKCGFDKFRRLKRKIDKRKF